MKNYSLIIGIDISKNSLDVCFLSLNEHTKISFQKIGNNVKEIKSLLKMTDVQSTLICMEDTGVYGMHLYTTLAGLEIDFAVVPAIHIKRSKGLVRGKSDKADAKDIAMYARRHMSELKKYEIPEVAFQKLKLYIAEREKLVKAIKQFDSTNEGICYVDKSLSGELRKNNGKTVKMLKLQLKEIEKLIKDLTVKDELINKQMNLLQSIPGIGFQTALALILYTKCFKSFDSWRQLACYAGIAPFPYQSGTSINGKSKVSNLAQKKLKSSIHMASLTMKKYDVETKQYFERKVAEGKNKMSVINSVRCKLIARAFAVINRGTPFVNTQKFAV